VSPGVAPTGRHMASDLGVIARTPVAQLDPVNEADSRFFKRDRGRWKCGLRSARFSNAYCRRPPAPPRKMTEDPVQRGGQTVPVPMSAFSRHVSIMRLMSANAPLRLAGPRGPNNHGFRLIVDWSAAEDVTAQTFLEAWRSQERIADDGGSLRPTASRMPIPAGHPVTVGPPTGERGKRTGGYVHPGARGPRRGC
jgi:hypothetical protein